MLASARIPGQTGGISHQRFGKCANIDAHQAAVELADIDARDSQAGGIVRSIVARLRCVVVVRHADPEFVQQVGRENVRPVDAATVGLLNSSTLERSVGIAAGSAENGRLVNHRTLEAESATEAVLVADGVVQSSRL